MTQPPAPAEGWHDDPFGRHELRFSDGQRWMPYVRDGEQHGVDEPSGPTGDDRSPSARSALLDHDLLVVARPVDSGHGWLGRSVSTPDGARVGTLRRRAPTAERGGLRGLVHRDKSDVAELADDAGGVLLTLVRPVATPRSTVEVRDADGRDAGRVVQQARPDASTYDLLGAGGRLLGELHADDWSAWELRVDDPRGGRVASITRDRSGLDAPSPGPGDHVVRIEAQVDDALRPLVLACALSLEVAVRP